MGQRTPYEFRSVARRKPCIATISTVPRVVVDRCRRIYRCRSELDKHTCVERAVRCIGWRVLRRSIAIMQATCWADIPLPHPRRAFEAFAFSQVLSNPMAWLSPRFGLSSKQLQYRMDQPGGAFGRFSVIAQAAPKVLGPHRSVQFDRTDAPERMHKFLDTTHWKPLLPPHLQV